MKRLQQLDTHMAHVQKYLRNFEWNFTFLFKERETASLLPLWSSPMLQCSH